MIRTLMLFLFSVMFISCSGTSTENNEQNKYSNINKEKSQMTELKKDTVTIAIVKTNMGTIELELFADKAVKTVQNFVGLAEKKYYDGVIFHRVIDDFMIQGGDPTGTGSGGQSIWGRSFEDEVKTGLKHSSEGILSMANAGPNTNGSQFFITLKATPWLDGRHTVFGQVIAGMDVVKAIGKVKTNQNDRPINNVVMESVIIEKRVK